MTSATGGIESTATGPRTFQFQEDFMHFLPCFGQAYFAATFVVSSWPTVQTDLLGKRPRKFKNILKLLIQRIQAQSCFLEFGM